MPCEIADVVQTIAADGVTLMPVAGVTIKAEPDRLPIFIDTGSGFHEIEEPKREATTAVDGTWSISLPRPGEQDPTGAKWQITLDDGTAWIGDPPDVAGPLTLHDLKETYEWKLALRPPVAYIQAVGGPKGDPGPAGATGDPGPAGADGPAWAVGNPSAWSGSSVAYVVGNMVSYFGQTFRCITAHTSNGSNHPPVSSTSDSNWALVAAKGTNGAAGPLTVMGTVGDGFADGLTFVCAFDGAEALVIDLATVASSDAFKVAANQLGFITGVEWDLTGGVGGKTAKLNLTDIADGRPDRASVGVDASAPGRKVDSLPGDSFFAGGPYPTMMFAVGDILQAVLDDAGIKGVVIIRYSRVTP